MKIYSKLLTASIACALVLTACDTKNSAQDPAGPNIPPISAAQHSNDAGNGVASFEQLEICKVWESPSAISTDFDVTVGPDLNDAGNTTTFTRTLNDSGSDLTQCRHVAQFDGINPARVLQVTESVPANAELVSIDVLAVDQSGTPIDPTGDPYYSTVDLTTATWSAAFGDNQIGFLITFTNRVIPTGGEGCTPGYWKNHAGPDSWSKGGQKKPSSWVGYHPTDDFETVFGVIADVLDGATLIGAATTGGGGEAALGRHAVAALLNAAHPDVSYDLDEAGVIALVQDAYATGDFESAKNTLAGYNEQGCPL